METRLQPLFYISWYKFAEVARIPRYAVVALYNNYIYFVGIYVLHHALKVFSRFDRMSGNTIVFVVQIYCIVFIILFDIVLAHTDLYVHEFRFIVLL